jgi:hypothetical protein
VTKQEDNIDDGTYLKVGSLVFILSLLGIILNEGAWEVESMSFITTAVGY